MVIVAYTGWPVLAAGVASVLAGYFYTGAPIAYGRRGLGEVMVFAFMGVLMVMASAYVQVERLTWEQFFASLPVGLLVADILHANNLRDIENDRARGKVTIAGVLGRPAADYAYLGLTFAPFVMVPVCIALDQLPPESLLSLLAAPFALMAMRELRHQDSLALNALVRATAGLHMRFGLLLAAGFVLRALA
jgi:1,4-dihydroxy-2-naphthoate octaprenyltransferase